MSKLKLRFHNSIKASHILEWANKYMLDLSEENRREEEKIIGLRDDIQKRGYLTKKELHLVARWKSPRRADLTLENIPYSIKKFTEKAFSTTDDWDKINSLTQLRGIGYPTASVILHLYDKQEYPILDIHALWSAGLEYKTRNSYPFWPAYVHYCRVIANRTKVDMRTLDRAMWKYSVVKNTGT